MAMSGPLVMVFRETPSLAASVELLLDTVGFRVVGEGSVDGALARLSADGGDPVSALVIACNLPRSQMLRAFADRLPGPARSMGVIVVGDRAQSARVGWPENVRFVRLPFDPSAFVDLVTRVVRGPSPVDDFFVPGP